jgi:hypothetical protein
MLIRLMTGVAEWLTGVIRWITRAAQREKKAGRFLVDREGVVYPPLVETVWKKRR